MANQTEEQSLAHQLAIIRQRVNGNNLLLQELAAFFHSLDERLTALEAERGNPPSSTRP